MNKLTFTWDDFDTQVQAIVYFLTASGTYVSSIVGIKRGGLPLATVLSHKLGLPLHIVDYQTRDGLGEISHSKIPDCSTALFVDDICDGGKTIEDINMYFGKDLSWITLVEKKTGLVDYAPVRLPEDDITWVEFPWEKNNL